MGLGGVAGPGNRRALPLGAEGLQGPGGEGSWLPGHGAKGSQPETELLPGITRFSGTHGARDTVFFWLLHPPSRSNAVLSPGK